MGRLLVVAVVTVFGLVFAGIGLRYVVAGRRIRRRAPPAETDVTPVGDLPPDDATDEVVVSGTARSLDGTTGETPLTGAEALAARAEARGPRHHHGVGGRMHRTLAATHVAVPFEVADRTGRARVEPPATGRFHLDVETVAAAKLGDQRGRHALFWTPDGLAHADRLRAFHERSDDLDDDPFRAFGPVTVGSAHRYVEGAVEPGDEVYVRGRVVDRDADWGEARVAITGGDGAEFVLSDRPPGERAAAVLRRGRRRYYAGVVSLLVGLVVVAGAWVLF